MAATNNSGYGHGSQGNPQTDFEETLYASQVDSIEAELADLTPPKYSPSPKHEPGHSFEGASENPIKSKAEGQRLLDTGYKDGKQIYNITDRGKLVKFQPDNTPENGFHSYEVSSPRDVPARILKQMLADGKITRSEYNRFRKGKK